MRTRPGSAITGIALRVFLLQEIRDEPLQKTPNETDDQHHLPGQSARLEIGLSDLEARDDARGEEQQQNAGGDDADQKRWGPGGHIAEKTGLGGDVPPSDRQCEGDRRAAQPRLGSKPQIAGSWMER